MSNGCSSDRVEQLEAREGILDAVAVGHLAQLVAVLCAFEAVDDARLARPRFRKLLLQLGDIALIALERVLEHRDLGLPLLGHVAGLLLHDRRGGGLVPPVLPQRESRLPLSGVSESFLLWATSGPLLLVPEHD